VQADVQTGGSFATVGEAVAHVKIGFRLHTGWAILVVIAAEPDKIRVLQRCRLELLPPGRGRFVYHEAVGLPPPDAEQLVESVRQLAEDTATDAIGSAIKSFRVTGACMPAGPASAPVDLAAVLRSHTRIHAAEGALYASAVAKSCERLNIPLAVLRESQVWPRASANLGLSEAGLRARLDDLRRELGPPWAADHKLATAAALAAA
jgi:hypothetical protein